MRPAQHAHPGPGGYRHSTAWTGILVRLAEQTELCCTEILQVLRPGPRSPWTWCLGAAGPGLRGCLGLQPEAPPTCPSWAPWPLWPILRHRLDAPHLPGRGCRAVPRACWFRPPSAAPTPQAPRWSVVPAWCLGQPEVAAGAGRPLSSVYAQAGGVLGKGRKKLHCPGLSRVLSGVAPHVRKPHFPSSGEPHQQQSLGMQEGTDTGLLSCDKAGEKPVAWLGRAVRRVSTSMSG